MLSGFKNYNTEMARFEQSPLFLTKYEELIHFLWGYSEDKPVLSPDIERELKLAGPQVRALVRHGRRKGNPIGSSGRGYFMIGNKEKLKEHAHHLLERARSEMFTYGKMLDILEKEDGLDPKLAL